VETRTTAVRRQGQPWVAVELEGTAGLTDGTSDTTSEAALVATKPRASGLVGPVE